MTIFDNPDLVVRDVPAAVAVFQEAVGVVPRDTDDQRLTTTGN